MRILLLLGIVLIFVGCQSISNDRVQGTVDAGNVFFSTEAAQIGFSSIQDGTQIVATIQAKETDLAVARNINQQIAATVGVSSSPTPALVIGAAAPSGGMMDSMPEDVFDIQRVGSFLITGVSQSVQQADDCVLNPSDTFPSDSVEQLYLTFIGTNAHVNTPLRAEWYFNGELVTADEWTLPSDFTQACFWFVIDRNDTNFPSGPWSVQLIQFGNAVGSPLEFTITG